MDLKAPDYIAMGAAVIASASAIVGALIGGYIAGKYSLKATDKLLNEERALRKAEQERRLNAFLSSIHQELTSIYKDYIQGLTNMMNETPDNGPFEKHLHIIYDFPIYKASIGEIGLVQDEELRHAIIVTYALADSLVHKCQQNNQYNRELNDALAEQGGLNHPETLKTRMAKRQLIEHHAILRNSVVGAHNSLGHLMKLLKPYNIG